MTTLTHVTTEHVVIPTLGLMIVSTTVKIKVMSTGLLGSHVEDFTVSVLPLVHVFMIQNLVRDNVEQTTISVPQMKAAFTHTPLVMIINIKILILSKNGMLAKFEI